MKTLRFCEVCGVSSETKTVSFDTKTQKILCQKHRCQFKNHNIFFDNSQITQADLNEISTNIENNVAYIHLYNKYGIELYKTKIDLEDVDKVKNKRWRISKKANKIYVVTGSPSKNNMIYLSRFLLDYYGKMEVDHINGESLDNTKINLRIINRNENLLNLSPKCNSKTKIRGVAFQTKTNTYVVDFSYKSQRFYCKNFDTIEEAIYMRYLYELFFNNDFRYTSNDDFILKNIQKLTSTQKKEIELYFKNKLEKKGVQC